MTLKLTHHTVAYRYLPSPGMSSDSGVSSDTLQFFTYLPTDNDIINSNLDYILS